MFSNAQLITAKDRGENELEEIDRAAAVTRCLMTSNNQSATLSNRQQQQQPDLNDFLDVI